VSAASDVARMLTLVPWLLERPGASLREAADAFGVDARTIQRDLGHLDFCGLPGLAGGDLFEVDIVGDRVVVRMADELRRPLRPTPREALRLVLTVDAVAEALGEELPALRSAVTKVREALGIPEVVADVLEPGPAGFVADARGAVADRRRLVLHYQGRADGAPQRRELDPWALHVVDGSWYLQGHDHGAGGLRTFRLDRVAALEVTDEPVTVDAPDELPAPSYTPGPGDLEVTLELTVHGRWLLDAVDADEVLEREVGGARVRLRTDAPAWLARLVLTAGGEATVLAPASLREQVAGLATRALAAYPDAPAGPGAD
jgi:predicted DNA-binding transcriptional regulator YafY